jgi:glycosyltransferase involved in cell wall biosynthesis
VKIVALLQTFNERRFIANCIEHLARQGVSVYLIDNESNDETLAIAERYLGRGLIGMETLPKSVASNLSGQLRRKEELAASLEADWLIHIDADELHMATHPRQSLSDVVRVADEAGYNAINFIEFTFVPTLESPDHDHPDYPQTMRWYYPYVLEFPHRLNAWKRQDGPVDLVSSDGHVVSFPGVQMFPRHLYMRHFLFLSVDHAREKYENNGGFYRTAERFAKNWRIQFDVARVQLPSETQLRLYAPGEPLDRTNPLSRHLPILPV